MGPGRPQLRRAGSPGSCSAATSTPRTRSSPCRRCCSAPARSGFFAVPYTIIIYPLVFLVRAAAVVGLAPARLRHAGRLRPRPARLADAGAAGRDHRHRRDDAVHRAAAGRHRGGAQDDGRHRRAGRCIIAFAILAAYTYQSGLRAPALIAFVKDTLIYLVDHRRGHLHPVQARRLGRRSSTRPTTKFAASPSRRPTASLLADPQHARLRHAGVRLGAGAVPLPALDHRRAGVARTAT